MAGFDTDYLSTHKKFRADRKKLAVLFCLFALTAAMLVFRWLKLDGATVTVAMDELSVRIYESEEDTEGTLWSGDGDFVFTNIPYVYLLPETGGVGTEPFTATGFTLMLIPAIYIMLRRRREKRVKSLLFNRKDVQRISIAVKDYL